MWSDPLISITLYFILFAIGSVFAAKTKGVVGEALFLCAVYAIGFATGFIPGDSLVSTGIPAMLGSFGILLVVGNLGTMIELKRFLQEWRTVLVCCGGLAVMTLLCWTVGIVVYGKYYALCSIPPLAGGVVATQLVSQVANEAGLSEYAAFAALVCSFQAFVGIPLSAWLLHKYCDKVVAADSYLDDSAQKSRLPNLRIIKAFPPILNDGTMMVSRLLIVVLIGSWLAKVTGIPVAVVILILGIIFTELGFLERETLTKAGYMNFMMVGVIMLLPLDFSTLTMESLAGMVMPMVFFIALGTVGLMTGGALVGRLLKMDWKLAASLAMSAYTGYPLTEVIVRTVTKSYDLPADKKEKLTNMVLPQTIIAGFTTVTMASVLMGGVIAPMIFN